MAYAATWINRWDLPGGSSLLEVLLHDAAGVRPDVRIERVYPTAQLSPAFRNAEATAIITRVVADQNAAALAQSRSNNANNGIQGDPSLRVQTASLLDNYATGIADRLATPGTPAWTAAHDAALDAGRQGIPVLLRSAVDAARDVS